MRIQSIFTAAKLVALVIIVLAGVYHVGTGKWRIKVGRARFGTAKSWSVCLTRVWALDLNCKTSSKYLNIFYIYFLLYNNKTILEVEIVADFNAEKFPDCCFFFFLVWGILLYRSRKYWVITNEMSEMLAWRENGVNWMCNGHNLRIVYYFCTIMQISWKMS